MSFENACSAVLHGMGLLTLFKSLYFGISSRWLCSFHVNFRVPSVRRFDHKPLVFSGSI